MNAVILNGGDGNAAGAACRKIRDAAAKEFEARGWNVRTFDLDTMTIKPCLGCFGCWLKHPGTCVHKDDQEEILKALAAEDVGVWITPVTFGGYSSTFKKMLDRSIPRVLPFFIRVNGEVHHPQRYPKRRKLAVIGTVAGPDVEAERIFRGLADRNALNMQASRTETRLIAEGAGDEEIRARVREIVAGLGSE
jgi:multimeric flavodoxin WrbA